MTYKELCDKILSIIPTASFGEDDDHQIVIYTNMKEIVDDENIYDMDEVKIIHCFVCGITIKEGIGDLCDLCEPLYTYDNNKKTYVRVTRNHM